MNIPTELTALRALCRYETHGGYVWAAVMSDGEYICVKCLLDNYRQVFRATRDHDHTGWAVQGLMHSGETERFDVVQCANCNSHLWGSIARDADVHLLYDGSRGIYIPQNFATGINRECVTGVSDEDYAILEAGPDHELYWYAWEDVLDRARLTINGKEYFMYQDGDCWAVEKGAEWNEDSNVSEQNWIVVEDQP